MGYANPEDLSLHFLSTLNDSQAQLVLMHLIRTEPALLPKAEKVARALIGGVKKEEIADELCAALKTLDIHQLWAESGEQWEGYVDPGEHAYEMMEDIIAPFIDEMEMYLHRGMTEEAVEYSKGIINGICRYTQAETGELKKFIVNSEEDLTMDLVDWWRERETDPEIISHIDSFRSKQLYGSSSPGTGSGSH